MSLESKLLDGKAAGYCSSSEDEADFTVVKDEDDHQANVMRKFGPSVNTGAKGVLSDFREFREETKRAAEQRNRNIMKQAQKGMFVGSKEEREKAQKEVEEEGEESLDALRAQRLKELRKAAANRVVEIISKEQYLDAVERSTDYFLCVLIYEPDNEDCDKITYLCKILAVDFPSVKFVRTTSTLLGMSKQFAVSGVPTLQFYHDGELVGNFLKISDQLRHDFTVPRLMGFLKKNHINLKKRVSCDGFRKIGKLQMGLLDEKDVPKCVLFVMKGDGGEKISFMHPFRNVHAPEMEKPELPMASSSQGPPPREKSAKPVLKRFNFIPSANNESILMTEFRLSTEILANILNVHLKACNQPFEMKIDNVRFAAFPRRVRPSEHKCGVSHFSIVFALPANVESHVVEAFQRLSNKLALSFDMLQHIKGFITEQEVILNDEEQFLGRGEDPFRKIREKSELAKILTEVYEEVKRTGNVHKYIGDFIELGFCAQSHSLSSLNVVPKGRSDIEKIVSLIRPYHGILLLEDVWPTPDANPSVTLLLKHCSPDRSILDMSTASGIPLLEVFMIVRHLLLWTRAVLIYPLCNTNVYTSATSPQPLEKMIDKFSQQFGASFHLAAGLTKFNPPATLGSFIRPNLPLSEQQVRAKVVVALLRHQMLMQLHLFCYIMPPFSNAILPRSGRHCPEDLKQKITQSEIAEEVKPIVADICGQMLETESFAKVREKLCMFISMAPFMNGSHHVEDMKYRLNVEREVIEEVIDAFQLVIAKFLRPDFIVE
ncbi:unnamed protein product [Caenorhabditis auriculariae]|uniref:GATOR complex protein NPRL3 n=1 Tax=Caenorhabditis auriculariae TaxID=2777116 RepID=A0A8S1HCA5_9PELO|nr:unnamed protein product [Caenorhabditis auriculariae]